MKNENNKTKKQTPEEIAKSLTPFLFPVSDLVLSDKNPRTISDSKLESLKKSLKDFEKMLWLRPVIIDETNTVLGGNMRATAALKLQVKEIPVVKVSDLTEKQKKEFIIKDNIGFGEWDWSKLNSDGWDLEELNEWGLETPEDNYSQKNKEIDTDSFNDEVIMKLNFTQDQFIFVQTELKKLSETTEGAILKLLNYQQ